MNNPFRQLFGLFGARKESVLGIDIGSSGIKVVQLAKERGKAVLETYGELALGPYAGVEVGRATNLGAAKLAEALTDVMREAKITTKRCGLAIPLSSSLVSVVELPAVDPRELSSMIPIEARKYVPVPISEVTLDWWVIPREEASKRETDAAPLSGLKTIPKTEVLIAAIHNEAIARFEEVIRSASLESSFFEIEAFSAIRAAAEGGGGAWMILDMGAASTKLYIVERGVIRVSHILNRGAQEVTLAISRSLGVPVSEAESLKRAHGLTLTHDHVNVGEVISASLNYILSEANRVLSAYQRKQAVAVEKVVLAGGGVALKGFVELARTSFGITVSLADPFSQVEAPAFLGDVLKNAGPEFAVALGVALRRIQELP